MPRAADDGGPPTCLLWVANHGKGRGVLALVQPRWCSMQELARHRLVPRRCWGVLCRSFAARFFPSTLEGHASGPFCQFNDHVMHLFTSSLFLAGAVAALMGMWTCKRWGRKPTMMLGGVCFLAGTALVAAAYQTSQLVIGRVVLGFGVGFATQATPLYLSEMVRRPLPSSRRFASMHPNTRQPQHAQHASPCIHPLLRRRPSTCAARSTSCSSSPSPLASWRRSSSTTAPRTWRTVRAIGGQEALAGWPWGDGSTERTDPGCVHAPLTAAANPLSLPALPRRRLARVPGHGRRAGHHPLLWRLGAARDAQQPD